MFNLLPIRNYIILKNKQELKKAKQNELCCYIIYESGNIIYVWERKIGKWLLKKYKFSESGKAQDLETTGLDAYRSFYIYCGKEYIDKIKQYYQPIEMWESYEQLHYANLEYAGQEIDKKVYEFDANSAFTYGVMQLPDEFYKLKEYMQKLYDKKSETKNEITRSKYKNLQNYLIGYFARVKEFVTLRSEIIHNSNRNIRDKMIEIINNGGTVYLSNTDSIITDEIGARVMQKYLGNKVGQFKLELETDKFFYKSSNAYQIGDKVVYSGIKYFARKHTDLIKKIYAEQEGSLVEGYEFDFECINEENRKLCRIRSGKITVNVYNKFGEFINQYEYKIQ